MGPRSVAAPLAVATVAWTVGLAGCASSSRAGASGAPGAQGGSEAAATTVTFRVSCSRCMVRRSTGEIHSLADVRGEWSFERTVSPEQRARRPWVRLTVQRRDSDDVIHSAVIEVDGEVRARADGEAPEGPVRLATRLEPGT